MKIKHVLIMVGAFLAPIASLQAQDKSAETEVVEGVKKNLKISGMK